MESLKAFLKNVFETCYYKIKDSALFNTLLEKYEHLDLNQQKWISKICAALILLLILSLPLSFLFKSIKAGSEFKEKKQLIYGLIQKESQNFFSQGMSRQRFNSELSRILDNLSLSSNSEVKVSAFYFPPSHLPPYLKGLKYEGKQVSISGLNIEEVLEIAKQLSSLDASVKMVQLKINELSENQKYYSSVYSLIHFMDPKNPSSTAFKKST